ncbi:hypothetical protein PBOI14_06220 [Pseudomonas sp. Boi14]|nr:hypothetical protein PBOI14_06220 [Pseudomonas sp. Boi14]
MQFWRRSIQWQLVLSMGSALLVSLLVVVAVYTVVINHLTQNYLVDKALPSSIEAMRNDIERILAQPLTVARDIASNGMLRDWLAGGEDPAQAQVFVDYLEGIRAENQAFTTLMVGTATNHYYNEKGWIAPSAVPIPRTPGSTASSTATSRGCSTSTPMWPPASWRCSSTCGSRRTASWWGWPGSG